MSSAPTTAFPTMTDLAPKETWRAPEQALHEYAGLNASAYNDQGFTFTGVPTFCNQLCPMIKANKTSLQGICSTGHQNIAAQIRQTGQPLISECDAGLTKICVPIMVEGQMVGVFGGCGAMLEGGEIETWHLGQLTGEPEEKIEELARTVPTMSRARAEEIVAWIQGQLAQALNRQ